MSLSRSPVGELTQVNQSFFPGASNIIISGGQFITVAGSFFPGASNIIISGGQFIAVAGDNVDRHEHLDPAHVEHMLLQLRRTDCVQRSIADGNVGYSHENGGVTIIDALGEKLVFPPMIMARFSDAHDNLLKHFRWKVGEDRVNSRRYCLVKQGDGMRVDEDDWNTVVQAGEVLVMCMLIEKVWVESRKQTCPKCGDTRLGTQRDRGFYVCRRCCKRFTIGTAPKARRIRPPSEDDNTVATFVNVRKEFVKKLRLELKEDDKEKELLSEEESSSKSSEESKKEFEWKESWKEKLLKESWREWHVAEHREASRFEEVVEESH